MNLREFSKLNEQRCQRWHPHGLNSWSSADWLTAVVGELGEVASLVKMMNRQRDGLVGNKFEPTVEMLGKELADVFCYTDLYATAAGFSLADVLDGYSACEVSANLGAFFHPQVPEPEPPLSEYVVALTAAVGVLPELEAGTDEAPVSLLSIVVALYAFAARLNLDLDAAIVAKFNEVSERNGFSERIQP